MTADDHLERHETHEPLDGKCNARARAGGLCKRPAGWGTSHAGVGRCKLHGGSTPNGEKAAAKEVATKAVERFGLLRVVDPQEALLEELHRSAGVVAFLDAVMGDLDSPRTMIASDSPYFRIYREERKHYANVARECINAGIAERLVQLEADKARLVGVAVNEALDAIGAGPDARAQFTSVLLSRLRGPAGAVEGSAVVAREVAR